MSESFEQQQDQSQVQQQVEEQQQQQIREPLVVKEKDYEFYKRKRQIATQKTNKNYLSPQVDLVYLRQQAKVNKIRKINPNYKINIGAKRQLTLGAQKLVQNANLRFGKQNPLQKQTTKANNPLERQTNIKKNPLSGNAKVDPLSKKATIQDPLQRKTVKNPLTDKLSQKKKMQQEDENDDGDIFKSGYKPGQNKTKQQEINEIIKNEESGQNTNQETQQQEIKDDIYWKEVRNDFVKIFGITPSSSKMNQLVVNPFGSQVIKNEDRQFQRQAQSGKNNIEYGAQPQQTGQKELQKITVKNYLTLLEEKFYKMKTKWNDGDKVGSLQITIQQIKLLVENENPRFAPIKFVYVMDILEKFGRNVFQRMKTMAFPNKTQKEIKNISFSQIQGANISESTQEIARNWLKKVGSIRELMPRMYIEATLLPLYYFLDVSKIKPIIQRLTKMTRAIGDYINCIYFSTFLLRICHEILPKEKEHILALVTDFLFYMKQGPKFFGKPGIPGDEYLQLFSPFLDTAFKYYSYNCSDEEFYYLFEAYQNSNQHQEVLKKIIRIFPTQFIAQYSAGIFGIIQNFHVDVKATVYQLFLPKISQTVTNKRTLGQICKLVWIDLAQVSNLNLFLSILASLIDLVQKSFQGYQKTQFFHNILDKFNELLQKDKQDKTDLQNKQTINTDVSANLDSEILEQLEKFLVDILESSDNVSEIISIEPFTQFISFFPGDLRPKVSVNVLKIFLKKDEEAEKISDPITVHSLLSIAKHINQALAISEEHKIALRLILQRILKKVDFGKDLEQMLNLYTDVRGNFGNISYVTEYLIGKVIDLTFLARKYSKNKMTKKVKAFLQACIGFCYITIPMVSNYQVQIQLINQCSQVSLVHNLISQAEAIFKNGLQFLTEIPEQMDGRNMDALLMPQMKNMLSFMIVVPDDPEHDYLHLFSGFYRLIDLFKWSKKNGELYKLGLLTDFIKYLGVQIQDKSPYHVQGVISNDQLFAEDAYKEKIVDYLQDCLSDIKETQQEILSRVTLSNDLYTNIGLVKQNLELINTLYQYLKPNETIKQILQTSLVIIEKRAFLLANDKIGKMHFKNNENYVLSTFQNIEKNSDDIPTYKNLKQNIIELIEQSKKSGF